MKEEGPAGFYKGFFPAWQRIAPLTVLVFVTFEGIKKLPFIAMVWKLKGLNVNLNFLNFDWLSKQHDIDFYQGQSQNAGPIEFL